MHINSVLLALVLVLSGLTLLWALDQAPTPTQLPLFEHKDQIKMELLDD